MASFGAIMVGLIFKMKGIKKTFKQDPLPYQKIRKDDVYQPPKWMEKDTSIEAVKIQQSHVFKMSPKKAKSNNWLLIYCPGGAFVSGPNYFSWTFINQIAHQTNTEAWLVNYPKAPEHNIDTITQNIYEIYQQALLTHKPEHIVLVGDSAGGHLIVGLVQTLLSKDEKTPGMLHAISPLVDTSMQNKQIAAIDTVDIMLSKKGILSANNMCAGSHNLNTVKMSPLYGSFKDFPESHVYVAENDILSPDIDLMIQKMKAESVVVHRHFGAKMPHVWPIFPIMKEAKTARDSIIKSIQLRQQNT